MNLLFVNPTFRKWGGVEEVVVLLADHFRRLGHRIVVVSDDTPATLRGHFSPPDVHHALPLKRKALALRNGLALARIARRSRIDLISSHQKKTSVLCVPVGRLLGIPVVHSAHSQIADWRARWFSYLGQRVVANSEATRDHLVRVLAVRPEHVTVIHDAGRPVPAPRAEEVERVRAEFGLAPGQPVLVCLGRLTEEKGHEVLLRAMPAIRAEQPAARLLIVGKGHLRARLEALSAALDLAASVTFTGYREDASAIVCAATLAVHPSVYDAFPLTNIECLRLGVPVVTTAIQGIPEMIRDGETGVLVPPNDVGALAAAVCGLLRQPERLRSLGRRGQAAVVARFDPTLMCQRYEAYFASVLRHELRPELRAALERATAQQAGAGQA